MKMISGIAAVAALFACAPAMAQDGDDYKFVLVNSSSVAATEFVTMRKNGTWSSNWLSSPIKAAEKRALVFAEGDDRCEIRTRITFADGSKFDTAVNYCGVTDVIATDDTLYSK